MGLESKTFQLINGLLYKMGLDQVLHRLVMEEEILSVLKERHVGLGAITTKVLLEGLWWPTLHTNAHKWVLGCDTFQRVGKPLKGDFIPLLPS